MRLKAALLGAITNNFRAIWLIAENESVTIEFVLEKSSSEDNEEIEDIIFEFEALQKKNIQVNQNIIATTAPLNYPENARLVYLKKGKNA